MNKYIRVHSYVFKFSQLPRWSVCMENQLLARQRKKVHSGFAVKNLVVDLFVQRMKAIAFQRALEAWRNTNIEQPICDIHRRPAKFRVVKDLQKESYGRPYFTCADCENPCSLWMWADENQVEKPNCYHGQQTVMKRVKKDGPNKGRLFFCCGNENSCQYFQWAPKEKSTKPSSRDVEDSFLPNFYNSLY